MSLREKFNFANITGDGRLTKQQAMAAGSKPLIRHFDALDTEGRGYLTFDQVKEFVQKMKPSKETADA